jgi:hypothetical protein
MWQEPKVPAPRLRNLILSGVAGALIGVPLVAGAYHVQGGNASDFTLVGAITGAVVALAFAASLIRFPVVAATCGSILALTIFQVPVCDGSHIGMPALGAITGLIVGAVLEHFSSHLPAI